MTGGTELPARGLDPSPDSDLRALAKSLPDRAAHLRIQAHTLEPGRPGSSASIRNVALLHDPPLARSSAGDGSAAGFRWLTGGLPCRPAPMRTGLRIAIADSTH